MTIPAMILGALALGSGLPIVGSQPQQHKIAGEANYSSAPFQLRQKSSSTHKAATSDTPNCDDLFEKSHILGYDNHTLVDGFCMGPSEFPVASIMAKYPPTTRLLNVLLEVLKREGQPQFTDAPVYDIVKQIHDTLAREDVPDSTDIYLFERWYNQSMAFGRPMYGRSLLMGLESLAALLHPNIIGGGAIDKRADFNLSNWQSWLNGGKVTICTQRKDYLLTIPDVAPVTAAAIAWILMGQNTEVAKRAKESFPFYLDRTYGKLCTAARSSVICAEEARNMTADEIRTVYDVYLKDLEAMFTAPTPTPAPTPAPVSNDGAALTIVSICIIILIAAIVLCLCVSDERLDACGARIGGSRMVQRLQRLRARLCCRRRADVSGLGTSLAVAPARA